MSQNLLGVGPTVGPCCVGPCCVGPGRGGGNRSQVTCTCQVYITVLDENDNSPRFDLTSDSAISVPEDCPVGQRVATVKAQDPDAGSNGQVGIDLLLSS